MAFKLIVFDWDGTLMDSEARIVSCIQSAFADLGEPPPSRDVARDVIGLGLEEAMTVLWPDGGVVQRRRLMDRYRFHFLGANETETSLFPDARAVIDALDDRTAAAVSRESLRRRDLLQTESGKAAAGHG